MDPRILVENTIYMSDSVSGVDFVLLRPVQIHGLIDYCIFDL